MLELYQAEWCPHSHRVRQRLTELGVGFIARQVPAEPAERFILRARTGVSEIPVVVLEDNTALTGDADEILARLDSLFADAHDAAEHHRRAEKIHEPVG